MATVAAPFTSKNQFQWSVYLKNYIAMYHVLVVVELFHIHRPSSCISYFLVSLMGFCSNFPCLSFTQAIELFCSPNWLYDLMSVEVFPVRNTLTFWWATAGNFHVCRHSDSRQPFQMIFARFTFFWKAYVPQISAVLLSLRLSKYEYDQETQLVMNQKCSHYDVINFSQIKCLLQPSTYNIHFRIRTVVSNC